jgi:hypothetical protein
MKSKSSKKIIPLRARDNRLFTLEVSIIGGPMTEEFAKENPEVSRTIQIRGDQTLEALHEAIFDAFDREEEHLYEFELGKKPHDTDAPRFVPEPAYDSGDENDYRADETTIAALELRPRQVFYYWFDFGDDWWHKIKVVSIEENAPEGKYPRVTKKVGPSPPQYPDSDEEEDDEDDEEDEEEEKDEEEEEESEEEK